MERFICVGLRDPVPGLPGAAGGLPDLPGPAPVRAVRRPALDDARGAVRERPANAVRDEGELVGIGTEPQFAIGQRALLVPYGDSQPAVGLRHAARRRRPPRRSRRAAASRRSPSPIRTTTRRWSSGPHRFDCPIHLHAADAEWVMRPDPAIAHWDGETLELGDGLTLIRGGGHFRGGTCSTARRATAPCSTATSSRSSPTARTWRSCGATRTSSRCPTRASGRSPTRVEPFAFEALYGAWWSTVIPVGREGDRPPLRRPLRPGAARGARVSGPIVVRPGEGARVGNVEFLARTRDTPRFTFGIIDFAAGRLLEAHVHDDEDDAFYILEGELTFITRRRRPRRRPPGRSCSSRRASATACATTRTRPCGSSTSTRRRASTAGSASRTEPAVIFRQLTHDDLGCASYLIGDEDAGVAAVVDPRLDIDEYLRLARYLGVRIEHVLETHNHADHVSGHGRLAAATGATHPHPPRRRARLRPRAVRRRLGARARRAASCARCTRPATGPSTPRSRSSTRARGDEPWAVLTGDTPVRRRHRAARPRGRQGRGRARHLPLAARASC